MATDCNSFRPNFWRPATCANCFRPRSHHAIASLGQPYGRTQSLTNTHVAQHARSPLADRERQHIAVGVVKPYAVVDIPEELQRRYSEPYIPVHKARTAVKLPQKRIGSLPEENMDNSSDCIDELSSIKIQRMRSASVSVPCSNRPHIIPKRKAPLPPSHFEKPNPKKVPSPHPIRRHNVQESTPSQPRFHTTTSTLIQEHTLASTLVQEHTPYPRRRTTTLATVDIKHHHKTPPPKPPRTFSTFISSAEQESLLQQLTMADRGQYGEGDMDTESFSLPDYCKAEAVSSPTATSLPLFVSAGQLHSCIAQLMVETLESVCEQEAESLVHRESMWQVEWVDLELQAAGTTTTYQGIPLSIQCVFDQLGEGTEREITLSHLLEPHPHISLVRAVLSTPAHSLPTPSPSLPTAYILRDYISGEPLSQLLPKQRQLLSAEDYTQFVLLCLVQVFSALSYLQSNGVCHRDVGLDCLHAIPHGTHWLVRLSGFHYSLHRPGPVTATSFIYSYHELKWLGGADSRLPPEIMDTPANAQTLDYSRTDCFAVGCTMYEMMGLKNPFESDPDRVYQQYIEADLPRFTPASPLLQHLAEKLLRRDALRRPDASMALLITEAQLWLPQGWLKEPVSETLVSNHLAYERARLVACLARTAPVLPLILKAKFLLSCDVPELIRALSIF